MWGLGCLIWEVYNGTLNHPNDLAETENIPKKLSSTYMELVAANSAKRPNPGEKIKTWLPGISWKFIKTVTQGRQRSDWPTNNERISVM